MYTFLPGVHSLLPSLSQQALQVWRLAQGQYLASGIDLINVQHLLSEWNDMAHTFGTMPLSHEDIIKLLDELTQAGALYAPGQPQVRRTPVRHINQEPHQLSKNAQHLWAVSAHIGTPDFRGALMTEAELQRRSELTLPLFQKALDELKAHGYLQAAEPTPPKETVTISAAELNRLRRRAEDVTLAKEPDHIAS